MAKRKKNTRLTSDALPTATNVNFPIYVPSDDGKAELVVGQGRLRYGTLVIEMKDTAASVAIQRAIERGVFIGLGFVLVGADEKNEEYQKIVEKDEAARSVTEETTDDVAQLGD